MCILWRVCISLRKKLVLGSILCLSVVLIIISIIRSVAAHVVQGRVDTLASTFWLLIEACVAVIIVSLSTFRTLFTGNRFKISKERGPAPQVKRNQQNEARFSYDLPKIPSATLGGFTKFGYDRTLSRNQLTVVGDKDCLIAKPKVAAKCGDPSETIQNGTETVLEESGAQFTNSK